MEFNLDDFIAQLNSDRSKPSAGNVDKKSKLNTVWMNGSNLGNLQMLPIVNDKFRSCYVKLPSVCQYYGDTSKLPSGEGNYRILPKEFYDIKDDEEESLYNEVSSLLSELYKYSVGDNAKLSYRDIGYKTYSIFFGILRDLKRTSGDIEKDLVDCPCMFIYPSLSVIDKFTELVNTMKDDENASIPAAQRNKWLFDLLYPTSGRNGLVSINFIAKTNNQPGYDTSVNFLFNHPKQVIDPGYTIPEEVPSYYDGVIREFLSWQYDKDNNRSFDVRLFKELRDNIQLKLKELSSPDKSSPVPEDAGKTYENKNNLKSAPF